MAREATQRGDAVSEVTHKHDKSAASLECTRVNKSIIYIIMRKEKATIYNLSRSKAPKTQQICHYNHAIQTSKPFWLRATV